MWAVCQSVYSGSVPSHTGQRSRSGEICHRVFVVVNFIIQRAGHEARSFFSSDFEPNTLLPDAALGSFLLSLHPAPPPPPPPLDKKANIERRTVHFLLSITFIRFFPAAACHGLQIQEIERCPRDRLTALYAHFNSLIPPVLVLSVETSDTTSEDIKRWSHASWDSLLSFFLFRSIWRKLPMNMQVSLDASSTAGSSVVVRCAGIDRTNQRSLDCCRS